MRTLSPPTILFFLSLSACSQWELTNKIWTDTSAGNVPELVLVNGGTFQMGSNDGTAGEKPVHTVSIATSFYIGKYEVTVKQYHAFCSATKRTLPENPYWLWQDNFPIVFVPWADAIAYCSWLSEQTGRRFRLPTEAEWEYVAKGGPASQNFIYAGSNNVDEVAWYGAVNYKFGDEGTHTVGLKKPNQLGVYDMSGNVLEWCSDWSGPYSSTSVTNPTGPTTGTAHIFRGGAWGAPAADVRVTARAAADPTIKYFNVGFRVVQATN